MLPFTFIPVNMNMTNQIEFGLIKQTFTKKSLSGLRTNPGPLSLLNDFPYSYSKSEKKKRTWCVLGRK